MSMQILGGDQKKAERIAREQVRNLTVMDLGFLVSEAIGFDGENKLCNAVDENFVEDERRLHVLQDAFRNAAGDKLAKRFDEIDNLAISLSVARQKANFLLGYMAALRLLGEEAPKHRLGGAIQR